MAKPDCFAEEFLRAFPEKVQNSADNRESNDKSNYLNETIH